MKARRKKEEAWQSLQGYACRWVNITASTEDELQKLGRLFPMLAREDIAECRPSIQRPKIIDRQDYLFMILLFPVYNPETKVIEPHEVDFFLLKDTLITVHDNALLPLMQHYVACTASSKSKKALLGESPVALLVDILMGLLRSLSPMLVHVSHDIDEVEKTIFDSGKRGTIYEILRIKTNIVNFRKTISAHKSVIRHLITLSSKHFTTHRLQLYLENLVDETKEIWDLLDSDKDTIEAIHSSHQSILEARSNDIIRVLTMFSVIIFPLTLVAAIFAMRTEELPLIGIKHDFWFIMGIEATIAFTMLLFFKRKRWI